MTKVMHVVGIDPGLVHTGVVQMFFFTDEMEISVTSHLVNGFDLKELEFYTTCSQRGCSPQIFIEDYVPRSHLTTDRRMVEGVAAIRKVTRGMVLKNAGVKKVVRRELMDLLGVWSFTTSSHHQDLRSAARIALLGMLKDERMNDLLSTVVRDHLDGRTWLIR